MSVAKICRCPAGSETAIQTELERLVFLATASLPTYEEEQHPAISAASAEPHIAAPEAGCSAKKMPARDALLSCSAADLISLAGSFEEVIPAPSHCRKGLASAIKAFFSKKTGYQPIMVTLYEFRGRIFTVKLLL